MPDTKKAGINICCKGMDNVRMWKSGL